MFHTVYVSGDFDLKNDGSKHWLPWKPSLKNFFSHIFLSFCSLLHICLFKTSSFLHYKFSINFSLIFQCINKFSYQQSEEKIVYEALPSNISHKIFPSYNQETTSCKLNILPLFHTVYYTKILNILRHDRKHWLPWKPS